MVSSEDEHISVLHVDDDVDLATLAATFLERQDDRFSVESISSANEGLEYLADHDVDCIVSEYEMPTMDGIAFLEAVRETDPDLPFILFTGKGSEEIASEAIAAGVTEYLQKETGTEQYTVLANRILNAVEAYRTARERERLETVVHASGDSVYTIDAEGYFTFVNERIEEVTGYEKDELLGAHVSTVMDPADIERGEALIRRLLTTSRDRGTFEMTVTTADGERVPCENTVAVLPFDDEFRGTVGVVRDITERKERESALEQTNALLSTLVETLPAGVLAEDGSREILAINEQLYDLFGFPEPTTDVIGADCEQMAQDVSHMFADPAGFVARIDEVIDAREPVRNEELELADGRTFERSYRPIDLVDGDGHLWVYRDITKRKHHEEMIVRLHEVATDFGECGTPEDVYERTIRAAESLLECDLAALAIATDDLLEVKAMSEQLPLDERPVMPITEGIAGKAYRDGESYLIPDVETVDDVEPQLAARAAMSVPIGDWGVFHAVDDQPDAFTTRDLELAELLVQHTEQALERLEREHTLKQQNERLEEFTSFVSHDLRNPLNVATGYLEILSDEYDDDRLDEIRYSHDRMQTLTDELLTLARHGDTVNDLQTLDLATVVDTCWRNIDATDATLQVDTASVLEADPNRLKQLLENLMQNAVRHAGEDVIVTVGDLDDGFYVADTGSGVSDADREQIFESGFSTADDGTGLGLRIVKEVADAHDWNITVTDSSTGGARFEITDVTVVTG